MKYGHSYFHISSLFISYFFSATGGAALGRHGFKQFTHVTFFDEDNRGLLRDSYERRRPPQE